LDVNLHSTGIVEGLSYRLQKCRWVPNSRTMRFHARDFVLVPQELKTSRCTFQLVQVPVRTNFLNYLSV